MLVGDMKLLHPTLSKLSALVDELAVLAGFARLAGLTWRLAELAGLVGRDARTGRAGIATRAGMADSRPGVAWHPICHILKCCT